MINSVLHGNSLVFIKFNGSMRVELDRFTEFDSIVMIDFYIISRMFCTVKLEIEITKILNVYKTENTILKSGRKELNL